MDGISGLCLRLGDSEIHSQKPPRSPPSPITRVGKDLEPVPFPGSLVPKLGGCEGSAQHLWSSSLTGHSGAVVYYSTGCQPSRDRDMTMPEEFTVPQAAVYPEGKRGDRSQEHQVKAFRGPCEGVRNGSSQKMSLSPSPTATIQRPGRYERCCRDLEECCLTNPPMQPPHQPSATSLLGPHADLAVEQSLGADGHSGGQLRQSGLTLSLLETGFPALSVSLVAAGESRSKDPSYAAHRWWARRPRSLMRSILLAAVMDGEATDREFWDNYGSEVPLLEGLCKYTTLSWEEARPSSRLRA